MEWCKARRRAAGAAALLFGIAAAVRAPAMADDLAAQKAAAHQLAGSQLPSGLLEFDMDFLAGAGTGSGSSVSERMAFIARQASAAYGLAKYYEQTKDERVREPLIRFIEALGARSLPVGKSDVQALVESTRVLSLPFLRVTIRTTLDEFGLLYTKLGNGSLVAHDGDYATAWAGTTALALLAELHFFRASGDARFAPLRERWLEGLKVLRMPGQGFREFPGTIESSPYADSEAWLAVAVYADTFPDGAIGADEMKDIDAYMLSTYAGTHIHAAFHWTAMAALRRYGTTGEPRFVEFAETQARKALEILPAADSPGNSCAQVEGMAASAAALAQGGRGGGELYRTLRARIRAEMDKNNALQIRPGQERIAPGPDSHLFAPRLGAYAGAYLIGRYTPAIRVDMTHHCISAIAEMQRG